MQKVKILDKIAMWVYFEHKANKKRLVRGADKVYLYAQFIYINLCLILQVDAK